MKIEKTERISLKNLYRILTENDYPIYTDGVFTAQNRRGLTVNKFWGQIIPYDFKSGRYGSMIWRTEGSRNRYISQFINRSDDLEFYFQYADEVHLNINENSIESLRNNWETILVNRDYSYEVLLTKIRTATELYSQYDAAFAETAKFLLNDQLFAFEPGKEEFSDTRNLFMSLCMTVLTICALMTDKVCTDQSTALAIAVKKYTRYQSALAGRNSGVFYFTNKNSQLCVAPLAPEHYFGREEDVFELVESMRSHKKVLISGMGGVGKTELARQLRKRVEEDRLFGEICAIQYHGSMAESLVSAVDIKGSDKIEDRACEVLGMLEKCDSEELIIFVDNIEPGIEQDPLFERFFSMPVTMIVTGRMPRIAGLETYNLKPVSKRCAMLIFRDNFGEIMNEHEKELLSKALDNTIWRHTLTLISAGKMAKEHKWSVTDLEKKLASGETDVIFEVYRQMYKQTRMTPEERSVLTLFSAIPYISLPLDFIREYFFADELSDEEKSEVIEHLVHCGWLESTQNGFSMHPLIAETIAKLVRNRKAYDIFFGKLMKHWRGTGKGTMDDVIRNGSIGSEIDKLLASMVVHMMGHDSKIFESGTAKNLYMESRFVFNNAYGQYRDNANLLDSIVYSDLDIRGKILYQLVLPSVSNPDWDNLFCEELIDFSAGHPHYIQMMSCVTLGEMLAVKGRVEQARRIADAVEAQAHDETEFTGLYLKFMISMQSLAPDLFELAEEARSRVYASEDAFGKLCVFEMMIQVASVFTLYQKFETANDIFMRLEQRPEIQDNPMQWYNLSALHSHTLVSMGQPEEALGMLEEAAAYYKGAFGTDSHEYSSIAGLLAIAYEKVGRCDEAEATYLEVIHYFVASKNVIYEAVTRNNLSVLYIKLGKAGKAIKQLELAYPVAKETGGWQLAEYDNNRSKAAELMGNTEEAVDYLEKALPELTEAYGADAPKTIAAKERLERLKSL